MISSLSPKLISDGTGIQTNCSAFKVHAVNHYAVSSKASNVS